jgi:hypothetical protein
MISAVRSSVGSSSASSSSSGAGIIVSFMMIPSVALAAEVSAAGSVTDSATVTDSAETAVLLSSATARIAYSPSSTLGTVTDDSNVPSSLAVSEITRLFS